VSDAYAEDGIIPMSTYSFTEDEERVVSDALVAHRSRLSEFDGTRGNWREEMKLVNRDCRIADEVLAAMGRDAFGRKTQP
jgi:hypothetical protein